jgi:hypothetical protein
MHKKVATSKYNFYREAFAVLFLKDKLPIFKDVFVDL